MPNLIAKFFLNSSVLVLTLALLSISFHSQAASGMSDEDTILVEKQPSQKIPYSKIARKIVQRLFHFDTSSIMSFGQGKKNSIARSFSDFADRSKYRFNVKRDEVEVKFLLNF